MAFVWSPELATGNTLIDNQHKQLITAINALFDSYRHGKGRQEVERTMEFLAGYTIKHLADEEKLQEEYDYPAYLEHRQTHIDFKEMVRTLTAKMSQNGPTDEFISEVYVTICDWLRNHIKGEDFKMAAYIQSKAQVT